MSDFFALRAVKQGKFRAHEGSGRNCQPIAEYRSSWALAFADCKAAR